MLQSLETVRYCGNKPQRQHDSDAGYDLLSLESHTLMLRPGERDFIRTGTWMAVPDGHVGLVVPRSGLAFNHGITVLNAPGIIDAGYRGEIKVVLWNASDEPFMIARGDRIAQLLIVRLAPTALEYDEGVASDLTERGVNGFGSTGLNGSEAA